MEITKVHSDNRGEIYNFEVNGRQHVIVSFGPSVYRGGHYHETKQWHICIAGTLEVKLRDLETGVETEQTITEGDSLLIPAGVAHLFREVAGAWAVIAESRGGGYEATDYEPYRQLVRAQ